MNATQATDPVKVAASRGLRLFPYQRFGVDWIRERDRAPLFDAPGTGKSMQALMALPPSVPVLVACPSTAKHNWAKHARNWRPDFHVVVLEGARGFRWPRPGEIVIVNYEILPPAARELESLRDRALNEGDRDAMVLHHRRSLIRRKLTRPYPRTFLVADECHRLKNASALCTVRWRELLGMALSDLGRVAILSGTPLMNRKAELYTVLAAAGVAKDAFGTHADYLRLWDRPGAVAAALRRVSLRRERKDVLPDLPSVTREPYVVPITRDVRKLCDDLAARLRARGVTARTVTLEALARAASGTDLVGHISLVRAALAVAKLPALVEIVDECEDEEVPLVVFAAHRRCLDTLAERCGWGRITGDEDATKKHATAESFQAGKLLGVACGIRSAGEAIDLFRAWRAVFVDLDWTPARVSQAEDRLCRPGQTAKGLLYTRLVVDHWVERRVEELLREKQELIEQSVVASARR